tara:strand:- start:1163 stop:1558 length:396 start_codon:yes stop_codon:yes gene_type:complete
MKLIKEFFVFLIIFIPFTFLIFIPTSQAAELNLTAAQDSVGKRFASKFCEAKKEGFSSDSSSDFALNNTYLKFVSFPDDKKFIEDLWQFTLGRIRKDCGQYVTENEEINLRDFFKEEAYIASNRDLYLPYQ